MSKALYLIGAAGLGAASAIYFLDEKQGKKRRARFRKQFDHTLEVANDRIGEYSKEFRERVPVISREVGARAQEYLKAASESADFREFGRRSGEYARDVGRNAGLFARVAGERAMEYAKETDSRFTPSGRMVGALASALAFYGAGRRGMFGMLLRTLSLGMFLRALLASR